MLMLYFRSFLSSISPSHFDQELTFPLFEIYPPTHPLLQTSFSLRNTETSPHVALPCALVASLPDKIKELRVPQGWTLWSQPPKEKCPQREVQSMSVTSSFLWEMGNKRLFEYFYREADSKLQIRLVTCLLLWVCVAKSLHAVGFKKNF